MQPACGQDEVVGRTGTRHLVAAEEKRVLPRVRQRSDALFRQAVVYGVVPIFPVQEDPVPEMVEITDRFLHQDSVPWGVSGFHQVEQASHLYYYSSCLGGVLQPPYLF